MSQSVNSSETMRKRKQAAVAMRLVLSNLFPLAFMGFTLQKHPLKIGIQKDILRAVPELPRKQVRLAIKDYVQGRSYHQAAATPGVMRIDLTGHPCGVVTIAEANYHADWLKKIEYGIRRRKAKALKKAPDNAIQNP